MRRFFTVAWPFLIGIAVAACSGGSGAPPPAPVVTPASSSASSPLPASVSFELTVPRAGTASAKRLPAYVSPSTRSVTVTAGSTTTIVPVTPQSPDCTAAANGTTCTIRETVPAATAVPFSVTAYDAANRALSTASTTQNIIAGTANTLTLTLVGVIASASVSTAPIPTCTASSAPVTVNALDADGNTITGAYDRAIAVSYSDPTGNSTFTGTASVTATGQGGSIAYDGKYEPGATFTLTPKGDPAATATFFPTPTVCAEYPLGNARPVGLEYLRAAPASAANATGSLFFTEQFTPGSVGQIASMGQAIGTVVPGAPLTSPQAAGSITTAVPTDLVYSATDGNFWIADAHDGLDTLSPATMTGKTYGSGTYDADAVAVGGDGNIWFTDSQHELVDHITTAGVFGTPVMLPHLDTEPNGIAAGTDGAMWVTETGSSMIARLPLDGSAISEYTVPGTSTGTPNRIASDGAGNLWFTMSGSGANDDEAAIGKIVQATGAISLYPLPIASSITFDIVKGPDGNMYFTEATLSGERIGRVTPAGVVSDYPVITTGQTAIFGITVSNDSNIWFTEPNNGSERMGYLVI